MPEILFEIKVLQNEIKNLREEQRDLQKLLKKYIKGERVEPDEFISSQEFLEREKVKSRTMYHILDTYPHLRSKVKGLGLLINYTQYKKIKS